MALQPAAQELNPPVLSVVAMLTWRSPPLLPHRLGEGGGACWCVCVTSAADRDRASY